MVYHSNNAASPPAAGTAGTTRHLSIHRPLSFLKHGGTSPYQSGSNSSDEEEETNPSRYSATLASSSANKAEDLPDASRANRRPPNYSSAVVIPTKSHIHCLAAHRSKISTGHHKELKLYTIGSSNVEEVSCHLSTEHEDVKLTALAFKPGSGSKQGGTRFQEEGRYLWCGTKEGNLMEFDTAEATITNTRTNVHTAAVVFLSRVGVKMISLDESGKIGIWQSKEKEDALNLRDAPITQRIILDKYAVSFMVGMQLWVATAAPELTSSKLAVPRLRMYQPFFEDKPFNAVSRPCSIPDALGGMEIGLVTCGTVLPTRPDVVFVGHVTGHISIWSRTTYSCLSVQKLIVSVTSLVGVGQYLWAGERLGKIKVLDVSCTPWIVVKEWDAHDSAVTVLQVDPSAIQDGKLPIISASAEGQVHVWDGLLASDWLSKALEDREIEYSTYRTLKARLFTYNIDGNSPEAFENSTFPNMSTVFASAEPPDLIVLGLQEIVNLDDTKVVAKTFLFGGAGRRGRGKGGELGDRISHQYRVWLERVSQEIRDNAPVSYTMALTDNLVGLFTCIFVRDCELTNVKDARIASIKTGFGGRMGNKGAIAASLTIDDTSIAFVNCHLAAGQRKVRHRNADLVDILDTALFSSRTGQIAEAFTGGGDGSMILDHRVVVLSGDLNYRIELSRDHCLEWIAQGNQAGLLLKDQLSREMRQNPAFRLRHFMEAPITFLPTYKFKNFTNEWDPSEKRRVPSYCDRILWHCRREGTVECSEYIRLNYTPSDHRPVSAVMHFKIGRSNQEKRKQLIKELQSVWPSIQEKVLQTAKEYYTPISL